MLSISVIEGDPFLTERGTRDHVGEWVRMGETFLDFQENS